MIHLDNISRIGFGAYRVSVESQQHYAALMHALEHGCTLVDTASNYSNGDSERLIGKVIRENPELDFFLVTKAGYPRSENEKHCLDPDFLVASLYESMDRMSRPLIDGFLLHNPERCFGVDDSGFDGESVDLVIRHAFEVLEEMVHRGVIRYWGVSSNALHHVGGVPSENRLARLLAIADEVSHDHHFRLLQFPFNLLESDAALPGKDEGFLSLARRSGLLTIGNRPLNAKGQFGEVRLATYAYESHGSNRASSEELLPQFIELVRRRLQSIGSKDDPADFTIVQFLRDAWTAFRDPDLVHFIFRERLAPFVSCLYPETIPAADRAFLEEFEVQAIRQARQNMTSLALRLREQLEIDGLISMGDSRSLAELSIDHCLRAGIQHVLVGMRHPDYVSALRKYF